jgi:GAF domain-containing protein
MERDTAYFERVTRGLQAAAEASRVESNPELALRHITGIAQEVLGERRAGTQSTGVEAGEAEFRGAGIFFAAPARDHLILLAEQGYPPEQHRARISIQDSNPGLVVRTGQPKIVPNTDEDPNFRQILSTTRVGSSVYLPVVWQRQVLGMFNVAAQARYALAEIDLRMGLLFANLSAATWMALDGPRYLEQVLAGLPPWRAS